MSNEIETIRNFKKIYMKNVIDYSNYNDSLYDIDNFNEWKLNLIKRSELIRKMFLENEQILSDINKILEAEFTEEIANEFFLVIKEFNDKEIHDASIMIKIIPKCNTKN